MDNAAFHRGSEMKKPLKEADTPLSPLHTPLISTILRKNELKPKISEKLNSVQFKNFLKMKSAADLYYS
jgi:hypothetical protein